MLQRYLLITTLALACAPASDTRDASERAPSTIATIDSLTVTDSVGLPIGGSNRIRIAYWSQDRMVYCALATLTSVEGVDGPLISDERSCAGVQLLAVDSVRFANGLVVARARLREHTNVRIEPAP